MGAESGHALEALELALTSNAYNLADASGKLKYTTEISAKYDDSTKATTDTDTAVKALLNGLTFKDSTDTDASSDTDITAMTEKSKSGAESVAFTAALVAGM